MGKDKLQGIPNIMAAPPPPRDSRYSPMGPPPPVQQQAHSSLLQSSPPSYQSTSFTLPTQQLPPVPPQAQAPAATQSPADPLEQRVLDLLYPYRDECFADENDATMAQERMALILCENIAFLIRHHQGSYGKAIEPNDVSIASRNWQIMKEGGGTAGIGIFVNGNGFSHTVLRTTVNIGENLISRFTTQMNGALQTFFSDL